MRDDAQNGCTAVMLAAQYGHENVMRILIPKSNLHAKNNVSEFSNNMRVIFLNIYIHNISG